MKAIAVFPGTREIRLIDHPEPELSTVHRREASHDRGRRVRHGQGNLRVRVRHAAQGSDYLVIGHESLGEVVEVGSRSRASRSAIWPCPWCGGPVRMSPASRAAAVARIFVTRVISPSAASRCSTGS
jgi:threonine dehydrogenase-like Zn-dependent dehydrogenase